MKKFSKSFILAIAVASVMGTFASCEKNEPSEPFGSVGSTKAIALTQSQRLQVAQDLALAMVSHPTSFAQLNNAVDVAQHYGVDEEIYLYDILHQNHSKFLLPSFPLDSLRLAVIEADLVGQCGLDNAPYCGQLELYWPYHDDWDGVTPPIFVFEAVVSSANILQGIVIDSFGTISVQELSVRTLDDDVRNSYIVIREAEDNYQIFPQFKEGERTKNGITWTHPFDVTGKDGAVCYSEIINGIDTVMTARTTHFESSGHQYDTWINGGSEFVIIFARANSSGGVDTVRNLFTMSRKQIKNMQKVKIDYPVHNQWMNDNSDVYYRLYEKDKSGSVFSPTLSATYQGVSVSFTMNFKSSDELISEDHLHWNDYKTMCSSGNNKIQMGNEYMYFSANLFSTH